MNSSDTVASRWQALLWFLIALLALWTYAYGLNSQYAPSNGDEMVYAHIAHATAQTGKWLPLASELENMRNTKPPLLFWQAMVAGNWGQHWTLTALRTPSLIYLIFTAVAVASAVHWITRNASQALMAACIFLAFLSTFRYGRTYLTSAPETFWLGMPLIGLLADRLKHQHSNLHGQAPMREPGLLWYLLCGSALGLGLAYKSFALIAPAAAAWWLAQVLTMPQPSWRNALSITIKIALSTLLALAIFALWFALDPDPKSVWSEFVVRENAVKMSDDRGYWQGALSMGGSGMWAQALAYPVNAGLLFFVVLGLAWHGIGQLRKKREHDRWSPGLLILLAWAGVWLVVFLFPSQRSARYVIPAMPAVAILLALYWHKIPRFFFLPTMLFCALAGLMLSRIAWVGHGLGLYSNLELALVLSASIAVAVCAAAGLLLSAATRTGSVMGVLLVYGTFNLTAAPMDGPVGSYDGAGDVAASRKIAIPNGFNGQFERYRFLIEGDHHFLPYDTEGRAIGNLAAGQTLAHAEQQLNALLSQFDYVVWIQTDLAQTRPPCLPQCKVLGTRWLWKSRHLPGEVRLDNLWEVEEWLFRREWLLSRQG